MYAPVFPERMLALLLDLRNPLHRLDRRLHQLAVVTYRDISALLEFNGGVLNTHLSFVIHDVHVGTHHSHFLARRLAERFRPAYFARIALHPRRLLDMV